MTKRLIITLVIALLALAGSYIPLPGMEVLPEFEPGERIFFPDWVPNIFSLGVRPYMETLAYAWALALFIPRLRNALFAGSKTVNCWVLGLAVVIMLSQAQFLVSTLQQDYGFAGYYVEPLLDPSLTTILMLMAVLTGGGLVLLAMAGVITRKGLGNGLVAITAISYLPPLAHGICRTLIYTYLSPAPPLDPWVFGTFTILTAGSFLLFFWRRRIPLETGDRQQDAGDLNLRVVHGGLFRHFLGAALGNATLLLLLTVYEVSEKISPGVFGERYEVHDFMMRVVYPLLLFAGLYLMGRVMFRPTALAAELKAKGLLLKGVPGYKTEAALRRHANINAIISALAITVICQAPFLGLRPENVDFTIGAWSAMFIIPAWIADLALSYKHPGQEDVGIGS